MTEGLAWFECFPPRDLKHTDLTALVRILAGRPRHGVLRLTPVVVFELWLSTGRVRWLLGLDTSLAGGLPAELRAQLPGLGLMGVDTPERPAPTTAREVRCDSLSHPLRLDTASAVAAGVLHVAEQLGNDETAVVQWLVGPSHARAQQPAQFSMAEAVGLRPVSKPDTRETPAWKAKTAEPLFGVRGRIGATASTAQRAGAILRPLLSALSLSNGPHARLRASRQSSPPPNNSPAWWAGPAPGRASSTPQSWPRYSGGRWRAPRYPATELASAAHLARCSWLATNLRLLPRSVFWAAACTRQTAAV